jgi:hypothetical protein
MSVKMRDYVRQWLGLNLADLEQQHTQDYLKNFELRQKQRHEALMGMLNRVEQRLINAHAFDKPNYSPAQLDWDTVQAIALQQLRENPEKEN